MCEIKNTHYVINGKLDPAKENIGRYPQDKSREEFLRPTETQTTRQKNPAEFDCTKIKNFYTKTPWKELNR